MVFVVRGGRGWVGAGAGAGVGGWKYHFEVWDVALEINLHVSEFEDLNWRQPAPVGASFSCAVVVAML